MSTEEHININKYKFFFCSGRENGGEDPEDQRGAGRRDEAAGRRESRQDRKFPPKRETGTS